MRIFFMICFVLCGCATHKTEFLPVDYKYSDNLQAKRLDLVWQNNYPYEVCLLREMWPDKYGVVVSAFDSVALTVNNKKYFMELIDGDYCPKCITKVATGEKITVSIPYNLFHLPENLFNEPKRLEFSPKTFKCKGNL
jgi:hypothetical protein